MLHIYHIKSSWYDSTIEQDQFCDCLIAAKSYLHAFESFYNKYLGIPMENIQTFYIEMVGYNDVPGCEIEDLHLFLNQKE